MPPRLALAAALALTVHVGAAAPAPPAERDAVAARLEALRRGPELPGRLAEEARLLHFLAEATPAAEERARLHVEGLALAERALAQDSDDPAAILWWAAHRGSQATPRRPLEAIRIANDIEEALLRLRARAPDFEHAAADRVLGHLYQVAPPVVSLGSMKKAEQHLRAALARAPAYPGNQLFWLELLAAKKRCTEVRRGAEIVLASPELARHPLEAPGWTRQAADLLARARSCG
jgi:hypothetical protein